MNKLTDEKLLNELKLRFHETKNSLEETKRLMRRLEEVNKKLEESEALKSNFLSNIRNEINNPLSSIVGLAYSIITIVDSDPETIKEFANTIYREAFNLDFQLKNIFMSAEIESGESYISTDTVEPIKIVSGIIKALKHVSSQKQINISCTPDIENDKAEKFVITSDSEKLYLVLSNLIDNAIEYSPDGSEIKIMINQEDDVLIVTIQNFGELINIPNKNVIFDRFKQLDDGREKHHKGHGLGLSLSRDLVEMMGGTIKVESTESKGNVFHVKLPGIMQTGTEDNYSEHGNDLLFSDAEKF